MGGLGSFYSLYNVIKENKIEVVLNDLNHEIYNLNKNVQGKTSHKKMMQYMSNMIRSIFIKFDTYNPTYEQYSSYHMRLLKLLNKNTPMQS